MAKISYKSAEAANMNVDTLVKAAVSSVKTMQTKVQIASVAVLIHAKKCGDYTKANDLIAGCGNGVRGKALQEFFQKFGGLTVSADAKAFDGWKGKEAIKIEEAKAQMWWELKPDPAFKGADLDKMLAALIKNVEKAITEAGTDKEKLALVKVNAEKLAKVKTLAA